MTCLKPWRMLINVITCTALGILLLGCANNNANRLVYPAGIGTALPKAEYQVLGKSRYDQTWIDKTIEAEVAGFGFDRPKRRPASFDAPAKKKQAKLPVKKPSLIHRVLHPMERPLPPPAPKIEEPAYLPPPLVEPEPTAAPPPPQSPEKKKKKSNFIKRWLKKEQ